MSIKIEKFICKCYICKKTIILNDGSKDHIWTELPNGTTMPVCKSHFEIKEPLITE